MYEAINQSPEYQEVKNHKKEVQNKEAVLEKNKQEFDVAQKVGIQNINMYAKNQEAYIKSFNQLLKKDDKEKLQKLLSEACKHGIFMIADNFIAQDSYQSLYWNVPGKERPEYVT